MKIYAPFKYFRYKQFKFPLGFVYVEESDLKILKKMPIELGELKDRDGKIINLSIRQADKPKVKKPKKSKIRRH